MGAHEIIRLLHILVGAVEPVGETNADHQRLINTLKLIEVTEACLEKLADAAIHYKRPEASIKEIATEAREAMKGYAEFIDRVVGDQHER